MDFLPILLKENENRLSIKCKVPVEKMMSIIQNNQTLSEPRRHEYALTAESIFSASISEDTQDMPQSQSTAFLKHQKKGR